jgi:glutamine synthetase
MKPSPSGPQRSKVYAVKNQIGSLLDQSITRHFMSSVTDQNGKFIAEYVWIGGTGADMRSKGRTLPMSKFPKSPDVSPIPPLSYPYNIF